MPHKPLRKKNTPADKLLRVMAFGTFDLVHAGHLDFFRQARALAKHVFLIVSLARDANVLRIKGRLPSHSESYRLKQIKKIPGVDKAVLGGKRAYFFHIRQQRPDVIALGYDQRDYVRELRRDLKQAGMRTRVVRLRPFRPNVYKTSLLRQNVVKYLK